MRTEKATGAEVEGSKPVVGPADEIVGRGVRNGARLYREWFSSLTELAESGRGAAYVFVMGSMVEILKAFDLPVTFPEVNALNTAIRRVSREYLSQAEDYGYSPDICGYVKADVALQLRDGDHPMGKVPKPSIVVLNNTCNTYLKWGEIWERMHGIEAIVFDFPGNRSAGQCSQLGSEDFRYECDYVLGQIQEMITACEKVAGKKFDIDRFREVLGYANELIRGWQRVVELNQNSPAVFNAMTDGTVFLGVANAFRGTKQGAQYFTDLVEEMEFRADNGIGALERTEAGPVPLEQKFRLALVGTPCYPIFRRFNEMFTRWGGIFVASSYLGFASGGAVSGFQFDLDRPLESFAEGSLIMARESMDSMFHQALAMEAMAVDYRLDGVVYHPIKSCRTVSTGLADQRRFVSEKQGLPTLFMESDLMDPQVISEAQMRNRVDAFFEGLISRRQRAGG